METQCSTQMVATSKIKVLSRVRKDTGGIDELTADIKKRGLINPITIMDCGDGNYQLIAGLRRLEACKSLNHMEIRATILSPIATDEMLSMEYAENVQRKDFTTIERLEYADKIKAVEKAMARERQAIYAGGRDPESPLKGTDMEEKLLPLKRAEVAKGESRSIIAEKAGFSSTAQYERAEAVAAKRPDLLGKIDAGETTIYGAYKQAIKERDTKPTTTPISTPATPADTGKPQSADQITRAGHERLMKNPLYSDLWNKCKQAMFDANTAATELKFRTGSYENQIRGYKENVDAMSRRCKALEEENAALRSQIETKHTSESVAI